MAQCSASIGRLRFNFEWRLTAATCVMLPCLIALGFWQLDRAEEKRELEARWAERSAQPAIPLEDVLLLAAAERDDRLAEFEGHFLADYWLLDNRLRDGRFGYELLAWVDAGDLVVPVNLGWLAGDPARQRLPLIALPEHLVTINGRVHRPGLPPFVDLERLPDPRERVIPALALEAWQAGLSERFGKAAVPFVVRIDARSPWAKDARWVVVNQSPDKHTGYAVQWFAMAAVLALVFLLQSAHAWPRRAGAEK
jgi:surfeit locus 1 family protein